MFYSFITGVLAFVSQQLENWIEYVGRGFYDGDMDDYIDKFFIFWYRTGNRSEDIWYEILTRWYTVLDEFYYPLLARYTGAASWLYPFIKLVFSIHWVIDLYYDFYIKFRWVINRFLDDIW